MSRLTIIVAATKANGIGVNSRLPWRLSKEMKYFAQVTSKAPEGYQNAVIMGRNTWESIPKKFRPLPNRLNIVISSNKNYDLGLPTDASQSAILADSLASALERTEKPEKHGSQAVHRVFIIGGGSLYAETLALPASRLTTPFVDRILITRLLYPDFEACDVFMPNFLNRDKEEEEWRQADHAELQEWVEFDVLEGVQEENGVKYEFQMWTR